MKTLAADRAVSAERALNTAIVNADITRGYEEYLPSWTNTTLRTLR